jgi:hypothetical protein
LLAFFFGRPAPGRYPPRFDFLISLTNDFVVSNQSGLLKNERSIVVQSWR